MAEQKRGNAIQNLVSGASGAFIELALGMIVILALFGVADDMSFIETSNDTFFGEVQSSIQDGYVALGGIVLLLVVLIAFAYLRRRGVM